MRSYRLTKVQELGIDAGVRRHGLGSNTIVFGISEGLDINRLSAAVEAIGEHFNVLRRSFLRDDRGWHAMEGNVAPAKLIQYDLRGAARDELWPTIDQLRHRLWRPEIAPLYQCTLVQTPNNNLLFLSAATFLIDTRSLEAMLMGLSAGYAGESLAGIPELDQEELLELEAAYLRSDRRRDDEAFWKALLTNTRFSWDPARSVETEQPVQHFMMPDDAAASVDAVAQETGITTDRVLLTAMHLFLHRLTGDERIVTASHERAGDAGRVPTFPYPAGFDDHRQPFVTQYDRSMSVRDLLIDGERLMLNCNFHGAYADIEGLGSMSTPASTRLTNVTAQLYPVQPTAFVIPGLTIEQMGISSTDLTVSDIGLDYVAAARNQGAAGAFSMTVRDASRAPAVMQSLDRYLDLLVNLHDSLDLEIESVPMFTDVSRTVTIDLSQGPALAAAPRTAWQRICDSAATHPDRIAVSCGEDELTYAALMDATARVAAGLQPVIAGIKEPLVGLCMTRSVEMIVGLLGIMRAGAGYLPLDPNNPPDRIAYILNDANAAGLLINEHSRAVAEATGVNPILDVRELWRAHEPAADTAEDPNALAYVIYTSGTTGKPKGVMVERRNLAHHVASWDKIVRDDSEHRWLQFASINFDASVMEIFNSLTRGATLVVAPSDTRTDPEAVWELLDSHRITHAFIPPAMLRVLARLKPRALTDIFCGGEAGDDATVDFWSQAVRYWNAYGPTETTVTSSVHLLTPGKSATDLGSALPGYSMFVLTDELDLAPDGGVGEIWIGGDGVTRGYLGMPELTAARFIENPFGEGRIYRTGDLARRYPDGGLEFLGRNDFQVKVRGFRIELGDIETAIRGVAGVTDALVSTVNGPSGTTLAAWYTSADVPPQTVADQISEILPHYEVPDRLIRLDAFPLTLNGKIDRKRLVLPAAEVGAPAVLSGRQRRVQIAWANALAIDPDVMNAESHFFHIGGHSLAAAVAAHALTESTGNAVTPRDIFEHPVLADLATYIAQAEAAEPMQPIVHELREHAPVHGALISMMWSRGAQFGQDTTYTIVVRIDFDADCNPQRLRRALTQLLNSDPVFTAALSDDATGLMLTHDPTAPVHVGLVFGDEAEISERVEAFRDTAFDQSTAPLWRADVVHTEDGGTSVLFAVHHSIFDGWSLNLFITELIEQYRALSAGVELTHADRLTIFDYGVWASELESSEAWRASQSYWSAKLDGAACRIDLPATSSHRRAESNRWIESRFDEDTIQAMKDLASRLEITLSPVLFAAYLTWLWRVSSQSDLVVAYPYAGRDVPGTEDILGMFVTMGFLRISIDPHETFEELAVRVAAQMLSDREHLVASPYDTDLSSCGVPNTLFSLQSGIGLDGEIDGIAFRASEYPSDTSKADIGGIFYELATGEIEGRIEYDSSILDHRTIEGVLGSLTELVRSAAQHPEQRIEALEYFDASTRATVIANATGELAPEAPDTVLAAFAKMAEQFPERIAIRASGGTATYAELDEASDELARHLIDEYQVSGLVGLSMERNRLAVISLLAIMKSGCGYVPLDPSYPADRLKYIVEDAGLRVIIADATGSAAITACGAEGVATFDPHDVRTASRTPLPTVRKHDLAYTIYTSGSTGRPKGVLIEHHTVPRMILGSAQALEFTTDSSIPLLGTMNFDASVLQIFLPLLTGGTLLLPAHGLEKEPEHVHAYLRDEAATHVLLTPALLRNLPREPLPDLQMLGFGGEALDAQTAEYWSAQVPLYSLYGPTETTVMCSAGLIPPGTDPKILGRPLPGYTMQLLGPTLQPVPLGAIGEIYIGGGGEARGYLGRPELTMERFIADPSAGSAFAYMYRSGDLGRYRPDGVIEYFGRNDDQVKLRGFRIELGEIEFAAQHVAGVTNAAVMVRGTGDLRSLVAYLEGVPRPDDEVRAELAATLPEYMIPTFFVWLEKLPVNANGKIDRKALPEISFRGGDGEPPRPGIETQLGEVFTELLNVTGIARDDNFFQLGGNSLLAARLQSQLRERCGLDRSLAAIYAAPTIAGLAGSGDDDAISQAIARVRDGISLTKCTAAPPSTISTLLLTGATGFLGSYLVASLLEKVDRVICAVRASDPADAMRRITSAAHDAGIEIDTDRIDVVLADLATERLGIDDDTWEKLAANVDAIVHCGAWVHHRYSYSTLRPSNVEATASLLQLATLHRPKWFTFVSTESVGDALAGLDSLPENVPDAAAHPPVGDIGYLLGKWVSEQLVAQATVEFGVNAVIARAGNITGDSHTGFSNFANNHFWLLAKSCVQLGAYPDLPNPVELMPVDLLATQIADLALGKLDGLHVVNLGNPHPLTESEFMDALATSGGYALTREAAPVWQQRLIDLPDENALKPLVGLYQGDLTVASNPIERERTQQLLNDIGAPSAARPMALIPTYVKYLKGEGFFPDA